MKLPKTLLKTAMAFLVAGATRVVASSWKVDDEATCRLMTRFCKQVSTGTGTEDLNASTRTGEGFNYAAALHRAMKELREERKGDSDKSSPYYWAGFKVIGPASEPGSREDIVWKTPETADSTF